jgi:hypothetical protein
VSDLQFRFNILLVREKRIPEATWRACLLETGFCYWTPTGEGATALRLIGL